MHESGPPLLICGENRHAKTDVCILDRSQNDILLLVQVDNRLQKVDPIVELGLCNLSLEFSLTHVVVAESSFG